jgi:hypothetical protein
VWPWTRVLHPIAQYLMPTLHEPTFAKDMQEVYDGSTDPYKNFVVRMMLAISMQKLDPQYAGLADSYYLASMAYMEAVIRPKDLRTLQCLVLIAQYSLLTPTRTAIYYIVGLATRLCQQLGEPIDDEYITAEGILPGPVSEKKTVAIHFLRMRLLQAEMRRVLYQKKRAEPKSEEHPWYAQMQKKIKDWTDAAPANPPWSKPWYVRPPLRERGRGKRARERGRETIS